MRAVRVEVVQFDRVAVAALASPEIQRVRQSSGHQGDDDMKPLRTRKDVHDVVAGVRDVDKRRVEAAGLRNDLARRWTSDQPGVGDDFDQSRCAQLIGQGREPFGRAVREPGRPTARLGDTERAVNENGELAAPGDRGGPVGRRIERDAARARTYCQGPEVHRPNVAPTRGDSG